MVRLINQKLAEADPPILGAQSAHNSVRGFSLPFSGNLDVESLFGVASMPESWEGGAARQRAASTVSSATSSLRLNVDANLGKAWTGHEESWALPEAFAPSRRATFDESDFTRYRSRPAWKCKHCEGVGWSEEEPCDGCGRYLPENFQIFSAPRVRATREGDWLCETCGNTNWEWRTQCNRCHNCRHEQISVAPLAQAPVPIPQAPVEDIVKQRLKKRLSTHPAGVFKDNDWVCVSCGNINWDWRVKCHQCASAKPVAEKSGLPPPTRM